MKRTGLLPLPCVPNTRDVKRLCGSDESSANVPCAVVALARRDDLNLGRQVQRARADAHLKRIPPRKLDRGAKAHAMQRNVLNHHLKLSGIGRVVVEGDRPRRI